MKRVLILTYYWPPSGGSGVQRWLKFVKYLRKFDIEPIVYTHSNGEIPSVDESLAKDIPAGITVLKQPIWEPYTAYKKLLGKKTSEKLGAGFLSEKKKRGIAEKIAVWIRGNFFIPDARKFWIKPSVRYLTEYLKSNPVDAVISTGPPHSMHMIGLGLKKNLPALPWLADFRDPWTNIDFYQDLHLTRWADRKHRRMERSVLESATKVISIGKTLGGELQALGAKSVVIIPNGFDTDDIPTQKQTLDAQFTIAHIGSMNKARNPHILWKALSQLVTEIPSLSNHLSIKLVGNVDYHVYEELKDLRLDKYLHKIDYIPHSEVILEQQKSHVLLLVVNDAPNAKGILTGKIFEYLVAQRPIIAIAPRNGDLAEIVTTTQTGAVFSDSDTELSALKKHITELFEKRQEPRNDNSLRIMPYSREHLTKLLAIEIKKVA